MHDILKRNLHYLERRSQDLANHLREIGPDPSLELITAESGDWTAKKYSPNGSHHFLHSRIDPRQEARMWAESQGIIMPHLVIIGVGLAYHVFELLGKRGYIENAYLIETDERIFRLAMRVHDFSSLIQNPSIHFLIGFPLSAIATILSTSLIQPFSFHIFCPVVLLYPDIYNPVRQSVEKHLCALRLREGDGATSTHANRMSFAKGVENLLRQMSAA